MSALQQPFILQGAVNPSCKSPTSQGKEKCCDGDQFTAVGSGPYCPACNSKQTALVADVADLEIKTKVKINHLDANPVWQKLHVTIPDSPECHKALQGLEVNFTFNKKWCGTNKCYHYWLISEATTNSTDKDVLSTCGWPSPGKCSTDNTYVTEGWHATVSRMTTLPDDKLGFLKPLNWTLTTWTIDKNVGPPYRRCGDDCSAGHRRRNPKRTYRRKKRSCGRRRRSM